MRRKAQQWSIEKFMVYAKSFWQLFHLLFKTSTPFQCTKLNINQSHVGSLQLLTLSLRKLKAASVKFLSTSEVYLDLIFIKLMNETKGLTDLTEF